MAPAARHGWVGIELFFVISAFLLFRLLDVEQQKDGQVNVRNFYLRRVLRIYPLLIAYYILMFVVGYGFTDPMGWARLGTTFASVDNVAAWWWDYNYTVSGVGHLWTLSFEFQVYLLLPFAFMAWKKWGTPKVPLGAAGDRSGCHGSKVPGRSGGSDSRRAELAQPRLPSHPVLPS